MTWFVAPCLDVLLGQLDLLAPNRGKASDGSIGDTAHQNRTSDHNPWVFLNGRSYVTARDFTHDPGGGLDCNRLADALVVAQDKRVKYVIWDRRIADHRWIWRDGKRYPPFTWLPYSGPNPHTKHLHLSVVPTVASLSDSPWLLPGMGDDMPDDVWSQRIEDYYTHDPSDNMTADVALGWAAANAGFARAAAEDAVANLDALSAKLDALSAKLDALLAKEA